MLTHRVSAPCKMPHSCYSKFQRAGTCQDFTTSYRLSFSTRLQSSNNWLSIRMYDVDLRCLFKQSDTDMNHQTPAFTILAYRVTLQTNFLYSMCTQSRKWLLDEVQFLLAVDQFPIVQEVIMHNIYYWKQEFTRNSLQLQSSISQRKMTCVCMCTYSTDPCSVLLFSFISSTHTHQI